MNDQKFFTVKAVNEEGVYYVGFGKNEEYDESIALLTGKGFTVGIVRWFDDEAEVEKFCEYLKTIPGLDCDR